jgi:hypothetical protein
MERRRTDTAHFILAFFAFSCGQDSLVLAGKMAAKKRKSRKKFLGVGSDAERN